MQVTAICQELEMRKVDLGGKYLGVPLSIPRSRKEAFKKIQDLVFKRLEGWKVKFLSQAGRLTLIKAVGATIPSYWMSTPTQELEQGA